MRGIAQYKKSRVEAASQQQVLVMLVQTAVRKLYEAEDLSGEPAELTKRLHHVRAIFIELSQALDHDVAPELCANLAELYSWVIRETVAIPTEPERLQPLLRVVENLMESWEMAVAEG